MPQAKKKKKEAEAGASLACVVRAGGPCNSRCIFCDPAPSEPAAPEELFRRIEGSTRRFVIIEGPGELLIQDDFPRLVHTARRAGAARIALFTNGRMLSYPPVASRMARLRPDIVAVSLHHALPERHDAITRAPESHAQAAAGIRNLSKMRDRGATKLMLRFVPVEENLDQLGPLCALARKEDLDGVIVDPPGGGALPARIRKEMKQERQQEEGGFRVLTRRDFEKTFQAGVASLYSQEGAAPPRFREDEKSLSLVVRTGCRNACSFCTTRLIQEENAAIWPLDRVELFYDDILDAWKKGARNLRMVAIEPLEHPEIDKLVSFAARTGFRNIEAWTSGRSLADPRAAPRLRDAGLTGLDIPILGASPEVHDAVTCSRGAFEETISGIENAGKIGIRLRTHLIITKQNLADLEGMLALAKKLRLHPPASILIPSPSVTDIDAYRAFMPSYSEVMEAMGRLPAPAADILLSRGLLNHVPPCIILKGGRGGAELIRRQRPVRQGWIRDGNLSEPGAKMKLRAECAKAKGCRLNEICVGYHAQYERLYGTGEFQPVKKWRGPQVELH